MSKSTPSKREGAVTVPAVVKLNEDLQRDFVDLLIVLHEGAAGNRVEGLTTAERVRYILTRAAALDPGHRIAIPGTLLAAHLDGPQRERARDYFDRQHARFRAEVDRRLGLDGPWFPKDQIQDAVERGLSPAQAVKLVDRRGEARGRHYPYLLPEAPGQPFPLFNEELNGRQALDNGQPLPQRKALPTSGLPEALPPAPIGEGQASFGPTVERVPMPAGRGKTRGPRQRGGSR